jgi:hypothetical protein
LFAEQNQFESSWVCTDNDGYRECEPVDFSLFQNT